MKNHILVAAIASLAPFAAPVAVTAQHSPLSSGRPVMLHYSYEHVLRSQIDGSDYHILVALPYAYVTSGARDTTRFPSLYLLDGQGALRTWMPIYRSAYHQEDNSLVLVGVDGPRSDRPWEPPPGPAWRRLRFTPPPLRDSLMYADVGGGTPGPMYREDGSQEYGKAPAFLRILREEIIPFVERHYRVSADRALHGRSMGGIFATYVLFNDPDLFTRYAITSPSLWWDGGAVLDMETDFARRHPRLDKEIYLSIGSEENMIMTGVLWDLAYRLCRSHLWDDRYEGIHVMAETIPGDVHLSAVHAAYVLRALFPLEGEEQRRPTRCGS